MATIHVHDFTPDADYNLNLAPPTSRLYQIPYRVHHQWFSKESARAAYVNVIRKEPSDNTPNEEESKLLEEKLLKSRPELHFFRNDPKSWGWHVRSGDDKNFIFMRTTLAHKIKSTKPEHLTYLSVAASVTYSHEVAHWLGTMIHGVGWKSHPDLVWARIVGEAGFYVEYKLFGGRVLWFGKSKWMLSHMVIRKEDETDWEVSSKKIYELFSGTATLPLDTSTFVPFTSPKGYRSFRAGSFSIGEAEEEDEEEDEETFPDKEEEEDPGERLFSLSGAGQQYFEVAPKKSM
ncbi:hypothetical protein HDV00_007690 [Rhizophlyctis rosea]|nr:hypothetical protein HDV00_007690 [Rhizophlyctis rosea]